MRPDFPQLARRFEAGPLVYLDSAATTLKPQAVLDAVVGYYSGYSANVHRGKHRLSEEASEAFDRARADIAAFINADPDEVVLVRNTTEALNLLADTLPVSAERRALVATSEHHSNLVPWQRRGALQLLEVDEEGLLARQTVQQAAEGAAVLSVAHVSNVTGAVQPLAELLEVARAAGLITVVDAAQSVAHLPIDVRALDCDFLAFSGHKVLGPTGIGVLYGKRERLAALRPAQVGGGTVLTVTATGHTLKEVPYRLEAGTPHIAGAIGLAAALRYLRDVGFEAVAQHDALLARTLTAELADLPGARLLGPKAGRAPIASIALTSPGVSADHLAMVLSDTHAIMTRSGTHCAHPYFQSLGLPGTLRASAALYNSTADVHAFAAQLRSLLERLVGRAR
ncbi:MAG: cysteine desulfurase [Archangiaceae bacterium]|nr:cysteine desulfurase [Archangiaceae bacterium]